MPYSSVPRLNTTNIQTHRGIELQSVTTGRGFRVPVGDTDLEAQLVQEDHGATGLADVAGDLAHRLAHQPGLNAHSQIAHLPFDLRPRRQGGDGIDDDDIDGGGADELIDDL